MRHLIIPDVHDKTEIVERILNQESFDRLIFLGDFFGDFTTGVKEAEQTARRVKAWLDQGVCLLGNHALCYGWGRWNADYRCSGFTQPKACAIHSVLDWQDWKKFKLHCWVEGETPLADHTRRLSQSLPSSGGSPKGSGRLALRANVEESTRTR